MRRIECAYERTLYINAGSSPNNHIRPSITPSSSLTADLVVEHEDNNQQGVASPDSQHLKLDAPSRTDLGNDLNTDINLGWDFGLHSWAAAQHITENDQLAVTFDDLNSRPDVSMVIDPEMTPFRSEISNNRFFDIEIFDGDSQRQGCRSPSLPSIPWYYLPSASCALVQNPPCPLKSTPAQCTSRLFLPRNFVPRSSSYTAKYLMAVLGSYPKLMASESVSPPYVHPFSPERDNDGDGRICRKDKACLPEPLAICSSIVQMYLTKTRESHAFIWKTILLEQQRIYSEVCIPAHRGIKNTAKFVPFH